MHPMSIAEALGEGIVSVPETLLDGIKRTGQGLAFWDKAQEVKIGHQNNRGYAVLKGVLRYGIAQRDSPVERAARIILFNFYESLPSAEKKRLIHAAGKKGWFIVGKSSTSLALSYSAGRLFINHLALKSVTKAVSIFTMSIEFNLLAMQGVLYKAGAASDRLKSQHPRIYSQLKVKDLDMVYFIIEKPMQQYLNAIRHSRMQLGVSVIQ